MRRLLMILFFLAPLVGCVATPLDLQEPVAGTYDVIGPAVGKTGGVLLFNFIPIAYNQRFKHAYDLAVQSQGADALINVTIEERWWWGFVLNGNVTTVRGTAVKLKNKGGSTSDAEATDEPAAAPTEDTDKPKAPTKSKQPRRKN